jgi:hypothetical protein
VGSVVGHEVAVDVPARTICRGWAGPAPWSGQASADGAGGDKGLSRGAGDEKAMVREGGVWAAAILQGGKR